ncbi:hypothetical protein MMC28_000986 [Mycoblastus sanguinarius]|nr:hypothetical protein [Mycoblastus sanguinarius]
MSSGTNPFRRRGTAEKSSNDPAGAASNVPRPSRAKTGKTVRIISPHSAASEGDNDGPQSFFAQSRPYVASPPSVPISPESSEEEILEDPFGAESDGGGSTEDEGTRQNTLTNSSGLQPKPQAATGMPENPFKKTLATLDPESSPGLPSPETERRPADAESRITRPHYDVDDFKRLLLTGEKSVSGITAPAAPPVSFQGQQNVGDSSSNTDASSISRQSLFEPITGPLQESPRTSHEGSPSDDERQRLVTNSQANTERIKPVAPRHRHGKLVKTNAPQTVSFEDPSLSFSSSAVNATTPKLPSTPNDVDKPLPPLPATSAPKQEPNNFSLATDVSRRESYFEPQDVQAGNAQQKRNPPTPPLSRRHSQLRPVSFASNSEPPTRMSEEPSVAPVPLSQSPPSMASKPPPPPPPRRSGSVRGDSQSAIPTSASVPPWPEQFSTEHASPRAPKARAPAPPNRSPSISAVKRPPTQAQHLPASISTAPPTPPRKRGSSQSSYTTSRLSGDYRTIATERIRSDSGASSISQLQMTTLAPSTESKDVMSDLSELQREVDELRGKLKN